MMREFRYLLFLSLWLICLTGPRDCYSQAPFTVVLGVAQDGGFPQVGCKKNCCSAAWQDPELRRHVSSLGIVDPVSKERWLLDCTPDFKFQHRMLEELIQFESAPVLNGIFLTHAHMGHYTGLMHLGREVLGAEGVPVYAMPRMRSFLETNGPWDQLIRLNQIKLTKTAEGQEVRLNSRIKVVPFPVPHRDEYSETVGYRITGPSRSVIFLPDIDKWDRWDVAIEDLVIDCDVAYLDGTFFDVNELPGRDMSEIPHPFVVESIERFKGLSEKNRGKVRFIHLNHSNPLLDANSKAFEGVRAAGHAVAQEGERVTL